MEANQTRRFSGLLEATEQAKANAFQNPISRDKYIAVRGLLRTSLAGYLNVSAKSLRFTISEHGKPHLVGHPLHFNLSHSGDRLLIAISDLPEIGVDIEAITPRKNLHRLAERCFSKSELLVWSQLEGAERLRMFYQLWTKKEAFVKAVGRGLALGLNQCEVDMQNGNRFARLPKQYGHAKNWRIIELVDDQLVCGAIVTPEATYDILYFDLATQLSA